MSRRPLTLPISLGITLLVLLVLMIVGWIIMSVRSMAQTNWGGAIEWTLFLLGILFLILVVVGVVMYLTLSIKAINLTRRQSNFIDSVTHELKSPIASLKLYLQTLTRRPVNAEEQAEFYRWMLNDVDRLDQLTNHILSAARLDRTPSQYETQRVDLVPFLTDCAHQVCYQHRQPIDIMKLDLQPCEIRISQVDLELIFRNLIDNAVKYGNAEQPMVEIQSRFHPEKGTAIVQIKDNGPGIPLSQQTRIFGRFVRLGTELERKKPGTGLGLYIVGTLVSRWKGRVRVASRDRRDGTVFEVTLPGATARITRSSSADPASTADSSVPPHAALAEKLAPHSPI